MGKQIIKCFKSERDFNFGEPLNLQMPVNCNEANKEIFTHHFLCGVVWGLTAKYAHPVAAAYDVLEDGTERLIRSMHACECQKKGGAE